MIFWVVRVKVIHGEYLLGPKIAKEASKLLLELIFPLYRHLRAIDGMNGATLQSPVQKIAA